MLAFTFHDLLARNLEGRADRLALVDQGRRITYAQLHRQVEAVAGALATLGLGHGDRVCIQLHKSAEEVVAMFAAARIGAVIVNVSDQWTVGQLEHVLSDCRPRVLVVGRHRARQLAGTELPDFLRRVIVNGPAPDHPKMTTLADLPSDARPPDAAGIAADTAAILYTSGSTGKPKGVMLSNGNLVSGARSVAEYLENTAGDRLLSLLPFSFDYGLSQLTTMFSVGGTVVLQKVNMPAEIVKSLAEQSITGFAAVPAVWVPLVRFLVDVPKKLPDLRFVTNSGGKIPDDILDRMPDMFPGVRIFLMYGLTEAFRSTYLPPELFEQKKGSIGRAIPNVETYVVDPEIGVCGPGQQGELVHRGDLICQGYWNDPAATAEIIKPCPQLQHLIGDEKVLYTGDLVRIDEDGFYWFAGRKDMLIKCSGYRISPTEVEEVVFASGLVNEVVAFGTPDEMLGQTVEIAVTLANSDPLDRQAIMDHCRGNMPLYMVPRRIHHWPGEGLPRTGNGKPDRAAIVQELGAGG